MNEKFFDLKKEKQDRMINAALKVFASNGYAHASTDDIVKEAGISKGLLFHYFISKLGLYTFIYDYSVKYTMLELSTGVAKNETDYFELIWQMRSSHLQVMRTYPYMLMFLRECKKENVSEALLATEEKRGVLPNHYNQVIRRTDVTKFKSEVELDKLTRMIEYSIDGLLEEQFVNGSFQPDLFGGEIRQYLDMIKKLTYLQP